MSIVVKLLSDHRNTESDVDYCEAFLENGNQDFKKTLNNYMELLSAHLHNLKIIRDSLDDSEMKGLRLEGNESGILLSGDEQIVERFVAFGAATNYGGSDDEYSSEGQTESSSDDSSSDSDNYSDDSSSSKDSESS